MKVLILLLLVSCASKYNANEVVVGVDSIKNVENASTRVYITSGMEEVENNDLLFKKLSTMAYKSLESSGYVSAPLKDAELVVYLSYEVSDPKRYTATRNVPVFSDSSADIHDALGNKVGSLKGEQMSFRQQSSSFTVYNRKITFHVYEAAKAGKPEGMVWATKMNSNGPSADLIKVFPHLLVVGAPYFGKQLSSQAVHKIDIADIRASKLAATP